MAPYVLMGLGVILKQPRLVRWGQRLDMLQDFFGIIEEGAPLIRPPPVRLPTPPRPAPPPHRELEIPAGAMLYAAGSEPIIEITLTDLLRRPSPFENAVLTIRDQDTGAIDRHGKMNEMWAANGTMDTATLCVRTGPLYTPGRKLCATALGDGSNSQEIFVLEAGALQRLCAATDHEAMAVVDNGCSVLT